MSSLEFSRCMSFSIGFRTLHSQPMQTFEFDVLITLRVHDAIAGASRFPSSKDRRRCSARRWAPCHSPWSSRAPEALDGLNKEQEASGPVRGSVIQGCEGRLTRLAGRGVEGVLLRGLRWRSRTVAGAESGLHSLGPGQR